MTFQTVAYGVLTLPLILSAALAFVIKPVRALFVFILVLPFHSLIITILLAQVGLPIQFVRVVASWKEILLISTFIILATNILVRRATMRLIWPDWFMILWLFQVCLYFGFHDLLFSWSSDLTVRAYGARDWLLYILPYFIGRLVIVSDKNAERILKLILIVGVLTSAIGIVERFWVPTNWHVTLGVPTYMNSFLNLSYPDYLSGLPPNYWAEFGHDSVRRAVSTYLSAQGFAVSFLLIIPVAVYAYYTKFGKYTFFLLSVCILALLLTVTRMTIIACFLQGLLIMWLLHKKRQVLRIVAVVLFILLTSIAVNSSLRNFVVNTLTLQDTSSRVRPERWVSGFQSLFYFPFGQGLGITGSTGTRFGVGGAGDEAGYFKVTGSLGAPGLVLFLGWFLGILAYAYRLFKHHRGAWQGIGLVTFVTAVGFLFNNLTAPPDQLPFTIYVFAWLAGLTAHYVTAHTPAMQNMGNVRAI